MEDKRTKIIEKGLAIIHSKGYNGTGLQEIVEAAGIPRGSFYYYFQSKKHFAIEVMNYYYEIKYKEAERILSDQSNSLFQRMEELFSYWIKEDYSRNKFEKGCLIGNFAIEGGDVARIFGSVVEKDFRSIERLLTNCLTEDKEANELKLSVDVEKLAEFIWNSWEGAILRMKATKSGRPLSTFQKILLETLLKK